MPSTYPLSPPDDRQLNIYRSPLNIDQQLSNLNRHFPLSFYRYAEESKLLTNDIVPAAAIILSALFSFRTHTHTHTDQVQRSHTRNVPRRQGGDRRGGPAPGVLAVAVLPERRCAR